MVSFCGEILLSLQIRIESYKMDISKSIKVIAMSFFLWVLSWGGWAQSVDYSVVSVREETGLELMKFSADNDLVAMPQVRRSFNGVQWFANRIIDISPDGTKLAFISARGTSSNIFVKEISRQGSSTQRTNRGNVVDFSYSPDGELLLFSEKVGKSSRIFQTDAEQGFVCRQITSGSQDYSPCFSRDMKRVFFARQEARGVSLWSYDVQNNYLSNYSYGMNPCVVGDAIILCARMNDSGRGEIWEVNLATGIEECIVSDLNCSFSTPVLSPNGRWIAFVGSTPLVNESITYWNTDIYICRRDGTDRHQLTYHAADDLSPVWSRDGRSIFFISQRGSADAIANIWRLTVPE